MLGCVDTLGHRSASATLRASEISLPMERMLRIPPPLSSRPRADVACALPALLGLPAVEQFNSGGFVAVSYQAQAKGIRKGDGVGAGGRAAARQGSERLQGLIGRVSLAEAKAMCPGLVVLPMRTDRYRQVADELHALLARFASEGVVEKAR